MGRSPFRQSPLSLPRCAELCSVRLLKRQGRIGKAVFALREPASPSRAKVSCPECQHGHLRAFISGLYSDAKPLPEAAVIVRSAIGVSKLSAEKISRPQSTTGTQQIKTSHEPDKLSSLERNLS